MRAEILKAIKVKLEGLNKFKCVYGKQRDWRTESDFPFACVFFPAQSFDHKTLAGDTLSSLRGSGLVTIRVFSLNSDDTPEFELDELLDTVLLMLLQDTTLSGLARTTDILQVQTDGGVLESHSIGDISLQVQI